jgi:hypothetical protein
MSAAAKLNDPALRALRRRLERWELEHLRNHAACMAEHVEMLEGQLQRAEDCAESWREDAMRLIEDSLGEGEAPGLTMSGRLVVVKTDDQSQTPALPAIGAELQGGTYAGITCDKQGKPYALVLLADKPDDTLAWQPAMDWAKSIGAELPNRVEGALLFANLPDAFEKAWHWTNEQYAGNESFAWCQGFDDGSQYGGLKSYAARARAVRRLPIDPSILLSGVPA